MPQMTVITEYDIMYGQKSYIPFRYHNNYILLKYTGKIRVKMTHGKVVNIYILFRL